MIGQKWIEITWKIGKTSCIECVGEYFVFCFRRILFFGFLLLHFVPHVTQLFIRSSSLLLLTSTELVSHSSLEFSFFLFLFLFLPFLVFSSLLFLLWLLFSCSTHLEYSHLEYSHLNFLYPLLSHIESFHIHFHRHSGFHNSFYIHKYYTNFIGSFRKITFIQYNFKNLYSALNKWNEIFGQTFNFTGSTHNMQFTY